MASQSTYEKLTLVLRDVFEDDEIVASPALTARQVSGWDSLGNVRLFVELEMAFAVRFSAAEIGSLSNVGELADLVEKKTNCQVRS
jgi:acyl carrier protein